MLHFWKDDKLRLTDVVYLESKCYTNSLQRKWFMILKN